MEFSSNSPVKRLHIHPTALAGKIDFNSLVLWGEGGRLAVGEESGRKTRLKYGQKSSAVLPYTMKSNYREK